MQPRNDVRARPSGAPERGAHRAQQHAVQRGVPERVCSQHDVRCGQERGRVGAPGVRDDGAISGCVVARYIRVQCSDEVHVGVVDDSVGEEGGMVGESDRVGREEGDGGDGHTPRCTRPRANNQPTARAPTACRTSRGRCWVTSTAGGAPRRGVLRRAGNVVDCMIL